MFLAEAIQKTEGGDGMSNDDLGVLVRAINFGLAVVVPAGVGFLILQGIRRFRRTK